MPADFALYLITDRRQVSGGDLPGAVLAALEGGVRAVQLREKDLCPRELYPLALELRRLTRRFGARLLINDRVDIALAVEADGVHLGGGSLPTQTARNLLGPRRLIGVSTHRPEEIACAGKDGADFVTFGPVFHTPSKAAYGPPQGIEALEAACASAALPVFALGGIKKENLPAIRAAGAAGPALISAILAASDPKKAAEDLLERLKRQ